MSVYIIAEAGVNHNGSFELACKLVDAGKAAGVDCIKFQTFKSKNLVSHNAQKAEYQKGTTGDGSQVDMLKKLELSYDEFLKLKDYCDKIGITFLSTPFDFDSIEFLNSIDMPFWKIPSGEITNLPYLLALAKNGKPVVMSTGMCEMTEIDAAIRVLQENGTKDIKLLHCNTEYPTPFEDVNLKAMLTMRDAFGLEVGYSDHIAAVLSIHNIGTAKATDVSATIEFPDEIMVLDINDVKDMEEPRAPKKPRDLQQIAYERAHRSELTLEKAYAQLEQMGQMKPIKWPILPAMPVGNTVYESVNISENIVEIETKRHIVHTKYDWFGGIYLVPLQKGEFKVKATLMCSEYEDPEETEIVFICE